MLELGGQPQKNRLGKIGIDAETLLEKQVGSGGRRESKYTEKVIQTQKSVYLRSVYTAGALAPVTVWAANPRPWPLCGACKG